MDDTKNTMVRKKTTWPVRNYLGAFMFGTWTVAMSHPYVMGSNSQWLLTQLGIALLLLARLGIAVLRGEQNRMGHVYIACMILALPIWILILIFLVPLLNYIAGPF